MYDAKRWGDPLTQFAENMTQPRLTPSHYVFFSLSLSLSFSVSSSPSRTLNQPPRVSHPPSLSSVSLSDPVLTSLHVRHPKHIYVYLFFLLSFSFSPLRCVSPSFPLSLYFAPFRSYPCSLSFSLFSRPCLTRIVFALSAEQANHATHFFL